MEILEVLGMKAHPATDHTVTDTQDLSVVVLLRVRWPNGEVEELEYGINPPAAGQKAAHQSKENKAWSEYSLLLSAWEAAFSVGKATEDQKPTYREPEDNSNENRVRMAVQAWLKAGGKIPAWVPPTPTADQIKVEAARRILEVAPEWYQRNLTARAVELALKGVDNWTAEEQAEVAEGQAIWDEIKGIRAASNALEVMDPRPSDFATNEAYWVA